MELILDAPYPKQIEFFKANTKYIAYGGARGGGKSWSARTKAILLALNNAGIQILLLRRTLNELRENHVIPMCKTLRTQSNDRIAQYKEQSKEFIFPNGSRIVLGYCDNEKDVLQFQGQAYEVIILEEATMFTEFQFQALTESNRLSGQCKTTFQPRMYFTCNPGGVGHMWVKRLFIDKEYIGNEDPKDYTFIQSLVYDNKFLMENDPTYVKTLENLPEDRRKAMLYGDWDVFEGQFFNEFKRDIHCIDPFVIPEEWNRYIAMDYGLDMFACLFIATDKNNNAYVYKEIHQEDLIISEAVNVLKEHNDKVVCRYAPPDLWNRNRDTGKSAYEIFKDYGIELTKCSNDRIDGWLNVKEYLKVIPTKNEQTGEIKKDSKLHIFNNCTNLIRCLPQLQHDSKEPNDCSTEPHTITHITDALRYFCVERLRANIRPLTEMEEYKLNKYENIVETIAGNDYSDLIKY